MSEYYIGLMSGTSVDAIDAALVSFENNKTKLIATHSVFIPDVIKKNILTLLQNNHINLNLIGETDTALGELFAEAALQLLKNSGFSREKITAIGSHGQTIYHAPQGKYPFTLQIADPNVITARTNITTVADFRRRDVALGGQGAPLTPAFHASLFPRTHEDQWVLNLGGIANITYISSDASKSIIGFDTGPANTLLDQWCEKHTGQAYDKNGEWARGGKLIPNLFEKLLADPYFQKPYPKSTGREYFNLQWLAKALKHGSSAFAEDDSDAAEDDGDATRNDKKSARNVQTTLTHLTAKTIADALHTHTHNILWLCGGGANNSFLIDCLQNYLPNTKIQSTEKIGIHPQWIECAAFAWLAKQTLMKNAIDLCEITGVKQPTILGGVFLNDTGPLFT